MRKGVEENEEPLLPILKGRKQHKAGDGVSHAVDLIGQKHPEL